MIVYQHKQHIHTFYVGFTLIIAGMNKANLESICIKISAISLLMLI